MNFSPTTIHLLSTQIDFIHSQSICKEEHVTVNTINLNMNKRDRFRINYILTL